MTAIQPKVDQTAIDPHLFGVEGADRLWYDLATCYESDVEPWADVHSEDPAKWTPRVIEEWTTHGPTYHLPAIDHMLEWIGEWTADCGEVDEGWFDGYIDIAKSAEVQAAAKALYAAIAEKQAYRMAKDVVRKIIITWDAEGEPLADGVPLYGPPDSGRTETPGSSDQNGRSES